jgi:hypothetical protein
MSLTEPSLLSSGTHFVFSATVPITLVANIAPYGHPCSVQPAGGLIPIVCAAFLKWITLMVTG